MQDFHNARMIETSVCMGFISETRKLQLICSKLLIKHFQRYFALHKQVFAAIDDCHAPATDFFQYFIAFVQPLPGVQMPSHPCIFFGCTHQIPSLADYSYIPLLALSMRLLSTQDDHI